MSKNQVEIRVRQILGNVPDKDKPRKLVNLIAKFAESEQGVMTNTNKPDNRGETPEHLIGSTFDTNKQDKQVDYSNLWRQDSNGNFVSCGEEVKGFVAEVVAKEKRELLKEIALYPYQQMNNEPKDDLERGFFDGLRWAYDKCRSIIANGGPEKVKEFNDQLEERRKRAGSLGFNELCYKGVKIVRDTVNVPNDAIWFVDDDGRIIRRFNVQTGEEIKNDE